MKRRRDAELLSRVGARVRLYRERCGLTQEGLSAAAGVPAEQVSRIETGKVSPTLATLGTIASALRVDLGALLARDEGAAPAPSEDEAALLERWRRLSPRQREIALALLGEMRSG